MFKFDDLEKDIDKQSQVWIYHWHWYFDISNIFILLAVVLLIKNQIIQEFISSDTPTILFGMFSTCLNI